MKDPITEQLDKASNASRRAQDLVYNTIPIDGWSVKKECGEIHLIKDGFYVLSIRDGRLKRVEAVNTEGVQTDRQGVIKFDISDPLVGH